MGQCPALQLTSDDQHLVPTQGAMPSTSI